MFRFFVGISFILFFCLVGTAWADKSATNLDYVLGAGDIIRIEIFDNADNELISLYKDRVLGYKQFEIGRESDVNIFSLNFDGIIDIPSFGKFSTKGKTIRQLMQEINQSAKIYDEHPKTVISILSVKSIKVYVLGSVSNPGLIEVKEDGTENNLVNLIARAGGYQEKSNHNSIIVEAKGKKEIVSLKDSERSTYLVKDGAYIYVPSQEDFIIITGEVAQPGVKAYQNNLTLADCLGSVGGFRSSGQKEVFIINDRQDMKKNIKVVMNENLTIKESPGQIHIARGAIIYVPKDFIASWRDIFSNLLLLRDTINYPKTFNDAVTYYIQTPK